eukprot:SAG31_NODE_6322_length_2066_cov_2.846467_2_plen_522_part_00
MIQDSENQEAEAINRARDTVRRRRQGGTGEARGGARGGARRDLAEEINLIDTDDEYEEPEDSSRARRTTEQRLGSGRQYRDWGVFSSDEEGDPEEPDGVPYFPSSRIVRPERLFRRQDYGRIERVNLYQAGEYEKVIAGFDQLTPACQFEVEYIHPVTGRLHDILREMASTERDEPGRIPAYISAELRAVYDLLEERLDGNMERAKCASGRSSEGFTIDAALAIMLELRDARMESGGFQTGAFGRAKQETAKRVRLARAKLRASRQAIQAEGGGKRRQKWKGKQKTNSQSTHVESTDEASAEDAAALQCRVSLPRVRSRRRILSTLGGHAQLGQSTVEPHRARAVQAYRGTRRVRSALASGVAHRRLVADTGPPPAQRWRNTNTENSARAFSAQRANARQRAARTARQSRLAHAAGVRTGGAAQHGPLFGSAQYWGCPGGQQARELFALERPGTTQQQYDRWVQLWLQEAVTGRSRMRGCLKCTTGQPKPCQGGWWLHAVGGPCDRRSSQGVEAEEAAPYQ